MVFGGTSNARITAGDYLIINADKEGNNTTYLSFLSSISALFTSGPMWRLYANSLVTSGDRAVQFRVSYPHQFESNAFSLQCVWMGPKGKGHSNFGKVVVKSSLSRAKLHGNSPPTPIVAHKVPNTTDQYYLEMVDSKKGKNKYLYAAGNKVTANVSMKSVWKFVHIGNHSPNVTA